jgi:hypothetical protein
MIALVTIDPAEPIDTIQVVSVAMLPYVLTLWLAFLVYELVRRWFR